MKKLTCPGKKYAKKALCLLLTAMLLLGALPMAAFAAEGESGYSSTLECVPGPYNSLPNEEVVFSAPVYLSNFVDHRSQLSPRAKTIYDVLRKITAAEILSAPIDTASYGTPLRAVTRNVAGVDGMLVYYGSGGSMTPASSAAIDALWSDYFSARAALRYDHPELRLWIDDMRPTYNHQRVNSNTYKITNMVFFFDVVYGGREKALYDKMMNNARQVAQDAMVYGDTYSRVKYVHDAIAASNTYSYGADGEPISMEESPLSHNAYSALVKGDAYEPICAGYADAVKIILDILGIPNALVESESHKWNNVKMDDGKWYNLDVTWDDGEGDYYDYDYFLVGSETVIDGTMFCREESHVEMGLSDWYNAHSTYRYSPLYYPVKSKVAYEYLGKEYPQPTFKDVGREDFFYDAVEWAASQKIANGKTLTTFGPADACKRCEAVTFLWRAMGEPEPMGTGERFIDVLPGVYYEKAVQWAVENGITGGIGGGRFAPEAYCKRAEIVTFLWRTAGKPEAMSSSTMFNDVRDDYYTTAVDWAVQWKITDGVAIGKFGPMQICNRGQIVTFLYRYQNNYASLAG